MAETDAPYASSSDDQPHCESLNLLMTIKTIGRKIPAYLYLNLSNY